MTKKTVDRYTPRIKDGLPPARAQTGYDTKMFDGELQRMAEQIKHGQYVEISTGSESKFRKIVESRGLKTVRRGQVESGAIVYVVTPEWLAAHPEV